MCLSTALLFTFFLLIASVDQEACFEPVCINSKALLQTRSSGVSTRTHARSGSLLQNDAAHASAKKNAKCSMSGDCQGMWTGMAVNGSDGGRPCQWLPMKADWYLNGGQAPELCLRAYPDFVSDYFKQHRAWHSCLDVAEVWAFPASPIAEQFEDTLSCGGECNTRNGTNPGVYVDVGANIGACVVQMLARPDVSQVVAFEPSPANLFYMTSSITKMIDLHPDVKNKVMLYPKALGSERSIHPLYEQPGNAGNTNVDTNVGGGVKMAGVEIETITLDEVFMSSGSPPYIHLMKVDAQGYELKIMKGGLRLLASGAVNAIHIELAPWWLTAQNATVREYLSILHVNNYDLRLLEFATFFSASELAKIACDLDRNGTIMDMVAVRNYAQGTPPRIALQCP